MTFVKGQTSWNKGKSWDKEHRDKISDSRKGKALGNRNAVGHKPSNAFPKGHRPWNWNGGVNRTERQNIMQSVEYKLWRKSVFERDDYTCVWCGDRDYNGRGSSIVLQADHIKPFHEYPELRFAIDNGRTLCISCHKKTGTWGRPKKNLLKKAA